MGGRGGNYSRSADIAVSVTGADGANIDLSGSPLHYGGKDPNLTGQIRTTIEQFENALGTRRGIVAVSTKTGRDDTTAKYAGTYSFVKNHNFNASGFVKGVESARLNGKDYNDAVSRWLKANQKKYGYSYSFQRAR